MAQRKKAEKTAGAKLKPPTKIQVEDFRRELNQIQVEDFRRELNRVDYAPSIHNQVRKLASHTSKLVSALSKGDDHEVRRWAKRLITALTVLSRVADRLSQTPWLRRLAGKHDEGQRT